MSEKPKVVECRVSSRYARFDLVIDGVLYLDAAVHGWGGIMRERNGQRALARFFHKMTEGDVRIYTAVGAGSDTYFYADSKWIRVLCAHGAES